MKDKGIVETVNRSSDGCKDAEEEECRKIAFRLGLKHSLFQKAS